MRVDHLINSFITAKIVLFLPLKLRRPVRVVERASLESLYTRKCIEGSNPSVSATEAEKTLSVIPGGFFRFVAGLKLNCVAISTSGNNKTGIEI
jgi:hypothetical protein